MLKKEKPMMSVTAIIQGAQAQQWSRNFASLGPSHFHLGLSLDQNLSMGSLGPQSPLEMKPDTASLLTSGQFSPPQGPNSPGSFSLSHGNILSPTSGNQNQKGGSSNYPPNHPLSGSKHLCSICGDRASGKHYGVYSCEGCKGFFKRTVRKDLSYACREDKACIIDKRQRNRCQYCRYQKCLAMGMKREAVQEERQRTKERDTSEVESTSNLHTDMSIERLLESEKRADRKCEENGEYDNAADSAYNAASNVQIIHMVEWVKSIPHFTTLPLQDQILLFRAGWNELLLAEVCHKSMDLKDTFMLENGLVMQRNMAHHLNIQNIFERIITEIIAKLREIKLDRAELSCLRCIILYNPDVRGIKAVSEVEMLREKVYGVLEEYCRTTHPGEPGRFAKLLLRLPALRSIGLKCLEYICYTRVMGDLPMETFLTGVFDTQPPDI